MSTEEKNIPKPEIKRMEVTIKGTSPYLSNRKTERIKEALGKYARADKEKEKKVVSKEEDPFEKVHWLDEKKRIAGLPMYGVWKGMVDVACDKSRMIPVITGKNVRGAIRPLASIVPITPAKKEDPFIDSRWGLLQKKVPYEIKRPCFSPGWTATMQFAYAADVISADNIVNLLTWSGFYIGIGSFSARSSGPFGSFAVSSWKMLS